MIGVLRFLQDAAVEFQPADMAVDAGADEDGLAHAAAYRALCELPPTLAMDRETVVRPGGGLMKAFLAFFSAILLLPAPLAAQPVSEWTVVTLALDGSWGVGSSEYYGPALASALRKCEAMSDGQSDCGADVTAVKQGWTVGILCGDHRVLVAEADLTTAILEAQARQIFRLDPPAETTPSCRVGINDTRE